VKTEIERSGDLIKPEQKGKDMKEGERVLFERPRKKTSKRCFGGKFAAHCRGTP
jgi:hypothetical protein